MKNKQFLLYEKQKNEIERLREALEKIVKLDCWGAGGNMAAGIAEQALKGEEEQP